MAFIVPTFNLFANVFTSATFPPAVPRLAAIPCQLRQSGRLSTGQRGTATAFIPLWECLFPLHTDIRDFKNATGADNLEVPAGSGRFYFVDLVDDVGKGFTNEYRVAMIEKNGIWPTPIP